MTVATKALSSIVLLACGFGLASLLGPPDLADGFADALRPAEPSPAWGALKPLDAAALDPEVWRPHESAAFRPPDRFGGGAPGQLAVTAEKPPLPPYGGPAPLWSPGEAAPIASWTPDTPRGPPAPAATRRDYGVSAAAWREPTAPVGWPVREAPPVTPTVNPTTQERAAAPPTHGSAGRWSAPPANPPISGGPAPAWTNETPARRPATPPDPRATWPGWEPSGATAPPPGPPASPWAVAPASPAAGVVAPADPVAFGGPVGFGEAGETSRPPRYSPTTEPLAPISPATAREPIRHLVTDGDTLTRLAERYLDDPQRAGDIFLANQSTLSSPDLLPIGAEIVIPNGSGQTATGQSATASTLSSSPSPSPSSSVGAMLRARLLPPQATPTPPSAAGLASW